MSRSSTFHAPWYITKGALPVRRAYMFASETTHAGASEIPWARASVLRSCQGAMYTYEVQDLALLYEVVQAIHDLLDRACPVPLRRIVSRIS